jgi:hypothetical protein
MTDSLRLRCDRLGRGLAGPSAVTNFDEVAPQFLRESH